MQARRHRDATPPDHDPGDEADWSYADSVLQMLATADKWDRPFWQRKMLLEHEERVRIARTIK